MYSLYAFTAFQATLHCKNRASKNDCHARPCVSYQVFFWSKIEELVEISRAFLEEKTSSNTCDVEEEDNYYINYK